jgi:hypothetical protein
MSLSLTDAITGLYGSDEELRVASEAFLNDFRTSSYTQYLANFLSLLSSPDHSFCRVACTYLWMEGRTRRLFESPTIVAHFASEFLPVFPGVLMSPVEDNFKQMITSLLSLIALSFYQDQGDTSIQTALLELLTTSPVLEKYIIDCLSELVVSNEECAGFQSADLFLILNADITPATFVAQTHLLLALARHFPEHHDLQALFPRFLDSIPDSADALTAFLRSTTDFAQGSSIFFLPCLDQFVSWLCELAGRGDSNGIRNLAMLCLSAMAQGSPEMCRTSESFFVPVVTTLLAILEQIDPSEEWDWDLNDDSPTLLAPTVAHKIFESCGCPEFLRRLEPMRIAAWARSDVEWPVLYSYLILYSAMTFPMFHLCHDADFGRLIDDVIQCVTPGYHPRLRTAALGLLRGLAHSCMGDMLMTIGGRSLPVLRQLVTEESHVNVRHNLFQLLNEYFSNTPAVTLTGAFPEFFQILFEIAKTSDRRRPILKLLGLFAQWTGERFLPYLEQMSPFLAQFLEESAAIDLKVQALHVFAMISQNPQLVDHIREPVIRFFELAWTLRGLVETDHDRLLINSSLCCLITAVSPFPDECYTSVLQTALAEANRSINILEVSAFDAAHCSDSMYIKVPSVQLGSKCYVDRSEVEEVKYALDLVRAVETVWGRQFCEFLPTCVELAKMWITNKYQIDVLKKAS